MINYNIEINRRKTSKTIWNLHQRQAFNPMFFVFRLLDYAIDDTKVRKQDSYIAVGAVAGNTLGKFLAWDWLRGNWEQLYSE